MHRMPRWPAYAAATWVVCFAIMHLYWAFGGSIGRSDGTRVPDNPLLLAIDALAAPLCVAGVVLALAPVRRWEAWLSARWPVRLLCAASLLAFVHSAPTIADDLLDALGLLDLGLHTHADRITHFVVEPFWMVGAVLCGLAAAAATGGLDPSSPSAPPSRSTRNPAPRGVRQR